jgi:hypothetical protein
MHAGHLEVKRVFQRAGIGRIHTDELIIDGTVEINADTVP